MRILPIHVIPIFLSQSLPNGEAGAQVRYFDAYYRSPPAIGFHVMGCQDENAPVVGFSVGSDPCPDAVQGFSATCDEGPAEGIVGFQVTGNQEDNSPVGFHVMGCPDDNSPVVGFSIGSESCPDTMQGFSVTCDEDSPEGVIGFIVEDV